MVREWRAGWAQVQNAHLRRHLGPDAPQVSHLSLADQGEARVASIHLGPAATALERRGIRTQAGDYNRDAQEHNREIQRLRQDYAQTADRLAAKAPLIEVPLDDLIAEARRVRDGLIEERNGFERERNGLSLIRPLTKGQIEREFLAPDRKAIAAARASLARVEARVERIRRSRLQLVAWIRNPTRMIFAKHAELSALDKARQAVRRVDLGLAERRAWLQSPQGQAMIAARRQPAQDHMSAVMTQRRTLERRIKRIDTRIEAATRTVNDLRMVQALGEPSLKVPAHAPDVTRFIRGVSGPARTTIARFPVRSREQAVERLRAGQSRGILRSLIPGR
jgi:chromosome segregation ATPase